MRRAMALGGVPAAPQPVAPSECTQHEWRFDRLAGLVCRHCQARRIRGQVQDLGDFPGTTQADVGVPVPIIYGSVSDEAEQQPDIVHLTGAQARCAEASDGLHRFDWDVDGDDDDLVCMLCGGRQPREVHPPLDLSHWDVQLQVHGPSPVTLTAHQQSGANTYGRVDIDRWNRHRALTGEELQVLLDGVDVTRECKAAHDIEGWAEVRRENRGDIMVLGAFERRTGQVVIRPNPSQPGDRRQMGATSCATRGLYHDWNHGPDGVQVCRDCGLRMPDGVVPQVSATADLHYCPNKGHRLRWEDCGEIVFGPATRFVQSQVFQRCIHCGEGRSRP